MILRCRGRFDLRDRGSHHSADVEDCIPIAQATARSRCLEPCALGALERARMGSGNAL